ncbi:MAG TPA: CHAP domain-containing protein [Oculatellaceae cyanobacterium]
MNRLLKVLSAAVLISVSPCFARHHSNANSEFASVQQQSAMPLTLTPQPNGIDQWHAPLVPNNYGFPELNVRVANYAVEHLGTKVGNGECWTLAEEALVAAGAQPARGYVFGRELAPNETWQPGDIIQFTGCQFVESQPQRTVEFTLGAPEHTAIVYALTNGTVTILQQNVNGDKRVQTQTIDFSKMTGGHYKVYSPVFATAPANRNRGGIKVRWFPF